MNPPLSEEFNQNLQFENLCAQFRFEACGIMYRRVLHRVPLTKKPEVLILR